MAGKRHIALKNGANTHWKKGVAVPGAGRKPKMLTQILQDFRNEGLSIPSKDEIGEMILLLMQCTRARLIAIATDAKMPMHVRATAKHIVDSGVNFQTYEAFTDRATDTIRAIINNNTQNNNTTWNVLIVDPKESPVKTIKLNGNGKHES